MGVERAVTLWYVRRQFVLDEIAQLEEQLAQKEPQTTDASQVDVTEVEQALARARAKLLALGPCPRPMMG
ncbi:MAG TPA: hypothetical protein VKX46_13430 [Ktedonobacteraceae bacterium]|nr:hypothetical protein [Ktedonobacteraceae bacterium]